MTDWKSRVWISDGLEFDFAENSPAAGDLLQRTRNCGLCFSGGGTRALSAGMGQLRALTALGLMDKVRYISSVSGGSWLSAAYTYYSSGAVDDATFLGPITAPPAITPDGLKQLNPHCVGATATHSLRNTLFDMLIRGVTADRLWLEAVGQTYFEPFGLYDRHQPAYFSLSQATVDDIIQRNPTLAQATFHTVRPDRPYLLIDATLIGPAELSPFKTESVTSFQMTPLYCGSPFGMDVTYVPRRSEPEATFAVGGGFIEPFAFGGPAPKAAPRDGWVELQPPASVFSLALASGTASSAFAGLVEQQRPGLDKFRELAPEFLDWPVRPTGVPTATPFAFGDGAVIENYGLLPLLQRRVENIAVFINTDTKLDLHYDPSTAPNAKNLDSYLPPLFGYDVPFPGAFTRHNQVFAQNDFASVVESLQAAKRAGRVTLATTELTTVRNDWWGIRGGDRVRVCWVYLDRVASWEQHLEPQIRSDIQRGNHSWLCHGPFQHFPNYKTAMENLLELVELTPEQVNLLADLTCWAVLEHADVFQDLLAPT